MSATFVFGGSWQVAAPVDEVCAAVVDLEHYPQWWRQVRAVAKVGPDDAWVVCRSALPYSLDLLLHAVSREPPVVEVGVSGDLEGHVRWHLEPSGGGTRMTLDQEVRVRGLQGAAAHVLRPLLRWNHHRMMEGCITGLRKRLTEPADGASVVP